MKTTVIVNGKNGDCLKNSIIRSEGIRTSRRDGIRGMLKPENVH